MRRSLALAFVSFSIGVASIASLAPGCGNSSIPVQDLCGWLSTDDNCYRRFAQGVADPMSPACGVSAEAADADKGNMPPTKRTAGVFQSATKLDVCYVNAVVGGKGVGGKIKFDPPLDPNTFPPHDFSFTIINPIGTVCGSGSYKDTASFSIKINDPDGLCETAPPDPEAGAGGTGTSTTTTTTTSTTTDGTTPLTCGAYTSQVNDDQTIDVTCPNGEEHKFNYYQLNKCDGLNGDRTAAEPAEASFAGIMPMAKVEAFGGVARTVNANGTVNDDGKPGYVKLRVYYPPLDGALKDVKPAPEAHAIEYFDCQFGPPAPLCADAMKSESETDVDCGGVLCVKRCIAGQTCIIDQDCDPSCQCIPDNMGLLRCCGVLPGGAGGAAGTGGTGGTGGMAGTGGMPSSSGSGM